jgi:hypothetical protein
MKHNIEPQDLAMDAFRGAFKPISPLVFVEKDGMVMKYRIVSDVQGARWLLDAGNVIRSLNLPLSVEIDEWAVKGVIFERWLKVMYVAKKQELACY